MYYALKFFSPVLASPYRDINGDVVVELISDLPFLRVSGVLTVQIFKLHDMTPIYSAETAVYAVSANFIQLTLISVISEYKKAEINTF